ncbi:unnamed protein product, partial [Rotaria sp. Silwood1]
MDLTCRMDHQNEQQPECYVCHEQFISRNDLQQHLRQKCYPPEMREQIGKLTQHIEDNKQRQQLQQILWKNGKLFDLRQPSIIKATVHHAIETGTHPPIYTPPYRVSYKDEQIQREEIDKLRKQGIIEESTSPCFPNNTGVDTGPELNGDLLTETSERTVKKLTLELLSNTTEHAHQYITKMPNNVQDSAMMVCYRECLSNLEKFHGGEDQKILQFINNIERIGRMIDANDDILHCMCTAKLDGEAKRWYEDNMTLVQWENLKSALLERFTTSDSSSKIFEQLKERKQKSDETITSYYDAVIKLCREYDSSMSQKIMISWLQNGIKDSLKTQIKRQMKLLPESARTSQAFLKI